MNIYTQVLIQSEARSCEHAMRLADDLRRNAPQHLPTTERDGLLAGLEERAARCSAVAFAAAQGFPS